MLKKMKITDTDKCKFCGEVDYIEHFFVTCQRLAEFWTAVTKWIHKMIGVKITNKISEKLFGIIKGEEKSGRGLKVEQANYVLIIAKLSIIKANFFDK